MHFLGVASVRRRRRGKRAACEHVVHFMQVAAFEKAMCKSQMTIREGLQTQFLVQKELLLMSQHQLVRLSLVVASAGNRQ